VKKYLVETTLTIRNWVKARDEDAAVDMIYNKYESQDIYDDVLSEVIDVDDIYPDDDFLEEE